MMEAKFVQLGDGQLLVIFDNQIWKTKGQTKYLDRKKKHNWNSSLTLHGFSWKYQTKDHCSIHRRGWDGYLIFHNQYKFRDGELVEMERML